MKLKCRPVLYSQWLLYWKGVHTSTDRHRSELWLLFILYTGAYIYIYCTHLEYLCAWSDRACWAGMKRNMLLYIDYLHIHYTYILHAHTLYELTCIHALYISYPYYTHIHYTTHILQHKTFIVGDDFKSGQTKMKSVLVDYLISAGLKPTSIVSYNHLGKA